MGEVDRRRSSGTGAARARARRARGERCARASSLFDLACPFTYLAAERVERAFDDVTWTPASSGRAAARAPSSTDAEARGRARAAERAPRAAAAAGLARALPAPVPAPCASPRSRPSTAAARAFVLAAGRLAFCGGFDLDDPEILAEAAAAAGIGSSDCLHAARRRGARRRDRGGGPRLLAAGADRLPALRVGRSLFWGEERVGEAAAAARMRRGVGAERRG